MKDSLIYITERITFQDINNGKISKIEVYEKQMNNWFIKPAELLHENSKRLNNYELKLPLLTLLITFFESHGQYLLGESSQNSSKKVFCRGFKTFLDYLVSNKNHNKEIYDRIDIEKFYSLVRCGLLHNGYIKSDGVSFFVDLINLDSTHVLYPYRETEGSWLINTENMLNEIKGYLAYYIDLVQQNDKTSVKFENMFDFFFQI